MTQNQTIDARLTQNWSILAVRYAFPVQLRPRRGEKISPALIVALLEVSNLSEGRVDTIRKALRDAVRERCAHSKDIDAAAVTVEDVHRVRHWLSHTANQKDRPPTKRSVVGVPKARRSKRLAARLQEEDEQKSIEGPSEREHIVARQTFAAWSRNVQDTATASRIVPETPAASQIP
jgi:hypothetical protein